MRKIIDLNKNFDDLLNQNVRGAIGLKEEEI